jgi:hypothetical protein
LSAQAACHAPATSLPSQRVPPSSAWRGACAIPWRPGARPGGPSSPAAPFALRVTASRRSPEALPGRAHPTASAARWPRRDSFAPRLAARHLLHRPAARRATSGARRSSIDHDRAPREDMYGEGRPPAGGSRRSRRDTALTCAAEDGRVGAGSSTPTPSAASPPSPTTPSMSSSAITALSARLKTRRSTKPSKGSRGIVTRSTWG